MTVPASVEFDPGNGCALSGRVQWRRAIAHAFPAGDGAVPAVHGARRRCAARPQFDLRMSRSESRPGHMRPWNIFRGLPNPVNSSDPVNPSNSSNPSKSRTRGRSTPYPFRSNSGNYVADRCQELSGGGDSDGGGSETFPGRGKYGPDRPDGHPTALARPPMRRGHGEYCTPGPGPVRSEVDSRDVEAFRRAPWRRDSEADGHPGPETWRRLLR